MDIHKVFSFITNTFFLSFFKSEYATSLSFFYATKATIFDVIRTVIALSEWNLILCITLILKFSLLFSQSLSWSDLCTWLKNFWIHCYTFNPLMPSSPFPNSCLYLCLMLKIKLNDFLYICWREVDQYPIIARITNYLQCGHLKVKKGFFAIVK